MFRASHHTKWATNIPPWASHRHRRTIYIVRGDVRVNLLFRLSAKWHRQSATLISKLYISHQIHFAAFRPMGWHWPTQLEIRRFLHAEPPYHARGNFPYLLACTTYRVLHQRQSAPNFATVKTTHCACQQPYGFCRLTHRAKSRAGAQRLNYCAIQRGGRRNAFHTAT